MKIPNNKSGKLKICPVDIKLKYKPIWVSGSLKNSRNILNTEYIIKKRPLV